MQDIVFNKSKECTLSCKEAYINKALLYELFFRRYDRDGCEYNYDLIDLINFPKLIKELEGDCNINDKNFNNNK